MSTAAPEQLRAGRAGCRLRAGRPEGPDTLTARTNKDGSYCRCPPAGPAPASMRWWRFARRAAAGRARRAPRSSAVLAGCPRRDERELAGQNIWQPFLLATGLFGQVFRVLSGEIGAG
jgi:hypothetical protein